MLQPKQTPPDLYQALTGADWAELAEAVRRFHGPTCPAQCWGSVRITRTANRWTRIIAGLLRLPEPAESATAELTVTPEKGCHKWIRKLGDSELVTRQCAGPGGLLREFLGPLEFRFRLVVKEADLHFQQEAVRFRLAGASFPVPGWAVPKLKAVCHGDGPGSRVRISVRVEAPLVGVLLSYEGCFERNDQSQ